MNGPLRRAERRRQGGIRGRFFLVGCPRSGTTLLQSLLAAHPRIASFPESHFFWSLVPLQPKRRAAGLPYRRARQRFHDYVRQIGRPELRRRLARRARLMRQFVKAYVSVLDDLTLEQGKDRWLEKTPENLHFVDVIERYLPGARFVHIVRNGPDVVASLYEVTRDYTRVWRGPWSIDACIARWNKDVGLTRCLVGRANHLVVRYEELVERPEHVLQEVCAFLDVGYDRDMIAQAPRAARSLIESDELWKARATEGIKKADASKFDSVFDEGQRAYVRGRLAGLNGLGEARPTPSRCGVTRQ